MAAALIVSIVSNLQHQQNIFNDYAYRLPMPRQALLAANPAARDGAVNFIALVRSKYRKGYLLNGDALVDNETNDQLSFATAGLQTWTENVTARSILQASPEVTLPIIDAESPVLTADGKTIAYLREVDGRNQLFLRDLDNRSLPERRLTPLNSSWNVYELTFQVDGSLVISATHNSGRPGLYVMTRDGKMQPIPAGEARYPAVSPDGRWLAYSHLERGNWNLQLLELATGNKRRLTDAPCNQIEPAWETDSKTILYGSDCGRALWFTAICRRRILR